MALPTIWSYFFVVNSILFAYLPPGELFYTCSSEFTSVATDGCQQFSVCSSPVFNYFQYPNGTIVPVVPVDTNSLNQYNTFAQLGWTRFCLDDCYIFSNSTYSSVTYFTGTSSFATATSSVQPCDYLPSYYSTNIYTWSYIVEGKPISVDGQGHQSSVPMASYQALLL